MSHKSKQLFVITVLDFFVVVKDFAVSLAIEKKSFYFLWQLFWSLKKSLNSPWNFLFCLVCSQERLTEPLIRVMVACDLTSCVRDPFISIHVNRQYTTFGSRSL